jgi:hypothetical protein
VTTDIFLRHFRIAESGYKARSSQEGAFIAHVAENRLRDKLRAGECPTGVVLIAPERGSIAEVDGSGELLAPACAWHNPADQPLGSPFHGAAYRQGGIYVEAVIEADEFEPDSASEPWADAGSILVKRGRIVRLVVPMWLAPVAAMLERTYGVEVHMPGVAVSDYEVSAGDVLLFPGVVSRGEAQSLREHCDANSMDLLTAFGGDIVQTQYGAANVSFREEKLRREGPTSLSATPWGDALQALAGVAGQAGAHFGLPVNVFTPMPVTKRYATGSAVDWHFDRNDVDPASYGRTVSLVSMLSNPGVDFSGGVLEMSSGPVDLALGDVVAFTAATRHRVTPVLSGARFAIIAFGAWDGWNL